MAETKKPASVRPRKTALAKPLPALPGAGKVSQALVNIAVDTINRLHRVKKFEAAKAIGEYLLQTFFEGKYENFHSHGRKHASFRALAERDDLSMSYVSLRNAVAFVEQLRLLPAKVANALPYSHHKLLLPVSTVEEKKELAEKAIDNDLSKRQLEEEVRKTRAKAGRKRGPGRRPDPGFVRAFRRLEGLANMASADALSPAVFTVVAVEDAADLVKVAEKHLATLGEVVAKAKTSIEEFRKKVAAEKAG
jgi:hypothetical protein